MGCTMKDVTGMLSTYRHLSYIREFPFEAVVDETESFNDI
jgi:hypothetical protein